MKMKKLKMAMLVIIAAALFSACKKDKPSGEINEEEVITTMTLKFTPAAGGTTLEYSADDADGPGSGAPVVQDIILDPSTIYNVEVVLLNKTANPVDTITEEVQEENIAHRFYYEPANGSNIVVANLNNDDNGMPLGITGTFATGTAASGSLKVTLRHYGGNPPNKTADDPVNSAKSSTDIEQTFITRIQ